jgi:hypothetical protein
MAKIVQCFFCLFMFSSISLSNIYSENSTSQVEQGAVTQKKVFKKYLENVLPANMFFGPYAFMYGVTIGGQAIVDGDSPLKANTKWLVAPLLAGALIQMTNSDIKKNVLKKPTDNDNSTLYYNILYIGPDISSIKDFNAESAFPSRENPSEPLWAANVIEAETGTDYPPLGYRTGFSTSSFGMDFEMSLLAHHTLEQKAYYSFQGEIYVEDLNDYFELPTSKEIDLPTHFLMLHSMYMGINAYYVLPNFGVTPYVGAGGGALLNSIQSQYPGSADLVQETGALALDEMDWGYHGMVGFRYMREKSFYYVELRPTFHNFQYESGLGRLKGHDQFVLRSFQMQLGVGKNIF